MVRVFTIHNPSNPQAGMEEKVFGGPANLMEIGKKFYGSPWLCMAFIGGKQCFPLRAEWEDITLTDGDIVYFIPKVAGTAALIVSGVVLLASVALVLSIQPPDVSGIPEADPVFSLIGQRNQVKLNQPIEDPYGKNRLWPSYAAFPYNQYYGNDQFQFQLFCLGQGSYTVDQVYIEDTPIENFQEAEYEVVAPGGSVTLFPDNVITSVEVGLIELLGPNEPGYPGYSGPFVANPAGSTTTRLEVDISLPEGLYYVNGDNKLSTRTNTADFEYRLIDDTGNPLGSWTTLVNFSVSLRTNTPQRFTYGLDVPSGRYEVRAVRVNNNTLSHRTGDKIVWSGLRAFLPSTKDYGDVTMLAVKARASNNLNDSSSNRINAVATRKLPIYDGATIPDVDDASSRTATRNPVWAMVNIFRAGYGGRLADQYLDYTTLKVIADQADTDGINFDWVYDQRTTVWEGAKLPAYVLRAVPMLNGSQVTMVQDTADQLPTFFVNPENTVSGTFRIDKKLFELEDYDGLEVEYLDQTTWKNETVPCVLPGQPGINLQKLQLKGVTDRQQAFDLGMYLLAKRSYERQQITVGMGMDAYIPTFGDTVRIGSNIPKWGQNGHVRGIIGNIVTLSENVVFGDGDHMLAIRGKLGQELGPFTVVPGAAENEVFVISGGPVDTSELFFDYNKEPPYYVFGPVDDVGKICRIVDIKPNGKGATLSAVVDDQRRFSDYGTAPGIPDAETPPTAEDLPVVGGLQVRFGPDMREGEVKIRWEPAAGALSYILQQSDDGTFWEDVTTTTATQYTLIVNPGDLYIRVAGVNTDIGPWVTWNGEIGVPTGVPFDVETVTVAPEFIGPSCRIAWQPPARDASSYQVEVYTGGVLRITAETTNLFYELTYEALDTAGGLDRDIDFKVYGKNSFGLSEIAAEVSASNPIPASLTGLSSVQVSDTGTVRTYRVSWTTLVDTDIAYYRVYASDVSGFMPGPENLAFEGLADGANIQIGDPGTGYPALYWRAAAYDVWGEETNMSAEQTAATGDPLGVEFSPEAGPFIYSDFPVLVTITPENPNADVRYSKSAIPNNSAAGTEYTVPVSMSEGETLYGRAFTSYLLGGPAEIGLYFLVPNLDFGTANNSQYIPLL